MQPADWVRRPAVVAGALALVVALPSLANGFAFDDVWIIADRELVHGSGSLLGMLRAPYWPPANGHGAMWRPLTLLVFAGQWALGGGSALLFHVVSVAAYAAVAGMVAALAARLCGPPVGLVAGMLFAVHPAHVEVTANVVGQAELLAALAYLAALSLAFDRVRAVGRRHRALLLLGITALTAVGIAAKEHAVTLPAPLLLVWWRGARQTGTAVRRVLVREAAVAVAVVAVLAVYLVARTRVVGGATAAGAIAAGLAPHDALQRAGVMLPVTLLWLRVLFFPFRLSADYSPQHLIPAAGIGTAHVIAVAVWTAIAVAAWRSRSRAPGIFVGVVLFLAAISIVSNVAVPLEILFAERLLFLPSVGWALAVGGVAVWAADRVPTRVVAVAIGVVVVAFGIRSGLRAPIWRDNDTLFAQMLREAPESFRGHWAAGAFAFARGDSVTGEREMRTAIRLHPDHPQPLEDLGRLYAQTGRYAPAVTLLSHAFELDSSRVGTAIALAISLGRTGRAREAIGVLDASDRLHGESQASLAVRTEELRRLEDWPAALEAAGRAVARAPERWSLRLLLAETEAMAGRCAGAWAQLDTAETLVSGGDRGQVDSLRARLANRNGPCN